MNYCFFGYFDHDVCINMMFLILKINNFRGDPSDISSEKTTLISCPAEGAPEVDNAGDWDQMMNHNVAAPMRLTNMLSPRMVERGEGFVINIVAEPMSASQHSVAAYSSTLHAIRSWVSRCSQSLLEKRIRTMLITTTVGLSCVSRCTE